jgi:hypothetical protein
MSGSYMAVGAPWNRLFAPAYGRGYVATGETGVTERALQCIGIGFFVICAAAEIWCNAVWSRRYYQFGIPLIRHVFRGENVRLPESVDSRVTLFNGVKLRRFNTETAGARMLWNFGGLAKYLPVIRFDIRKRADEVVITGRLNWYVLAALLVAPIVLPIVLHGLLLFGFLTITFSLSLALQAKSFWRIRALIQGAEVSTR